jgi:hypothetical protein
MYHEEQDPGFVPSPELIDEFHRESEKTSPELPTELWSIILWYGERWVLAPDLSDLREEPHRGGKAWVRENATSGWFPSNGVVKDKEPFKVLRIGLDLDVTSEESDTTLAEEPVEERLRRSWRNGFVEGMERGSRDIRWDHS